MSNSTCTYAPSYYTSMCDSWNVNLCDGSWCLGDGNCVNWCYVNECSTYKGYKPRGGYYDYYDTYCNGSSNDLVWLWWVLAGVGLIITIVAVILICNRVKKSRKQQEVMTALHQ